MLRGLETLTDSGVVPLSQTIWIGGKTNATNSMAPDDSGYRRYSMRNEYSMTSDIFVCLFLLKMARGVDVLLKHRRHVAATTDQYDLNNSVS